MVKINSSRLVLKYMSIKIAPSILSADFANLESEILALEESGADYIHFDVMDGSFVPNITIGPCVIKSLRKLTNIPFDIHLMIQNPQNHLQSFADAGADIITIHHETITHHQRVLNQIKNLKNCLGKNIKAGISLVPSTNENVLEYLYNDLDLILVMSVNPGFGGQKFLDTQLTKLQNISNKLKSLSLDKKVEISVDGGVNDKTAKLLKNCGANVLIAGSFIFENKQELNKNNYENSISLLRNI
jgi:ribulose-phosphate 3-epimerase